MSEAIMSYSKWAAAWYNRATIKAYSGDYQGAVNDYAQAIKLAPKMAEAYYNRGLILIFTKRTQEACPDLSKAGELGISAAYNVIKRYCK
jgi:tetratricopeptide (TPR) repeat protein